MNPKRILLVDDEPDIREVAALTLQAIGGWEIITASNGAEAITLALAEQPDAILLDVMMPGIDGPTTFKHLQEHPRTREIPVILLTAKTQVADLRQFEELGLTGIISKPFDPMSLPGQVERVLAATPPGA